MYVDGFVVAVPRDRVDEYRRFSEEAGAVWREHGALDYREFLADDVRPGKVTSFPQSVMATDDETVVFAYIAYESREHRDQVNADVMADPRMKDMDPSRMPFDGERMIYGGFTELVHVPGDHFGG